MQLKEVKRTSDFNVLILEKAANICSFVEDEWVFDYFFYPRKSKTLLVFMPSALNPKKRHVPAFHRWSWAEELPGFDVLSVSDPTLHLHPEILGGWMQGRGNDWVLKRLLRHIELLAAEKKYSNIVFCGSSLGGFVALQAGILAKGMDSFNTGMRTFTYAENPQICLQKYWVERHMNLLAKVCYKKNSLAEVDEHYLSRLDVTALALENDFLADGLVVVKESDQHHFQVQLDYLKTRLCDKNIKMPVIEVIPSSVDDSGHTPLQFDQMKSRVEALSLIS